MAKKPTRTDPPPTEQKPRVLVTMTQARTRFKEITERAMAGEIIILTKQGIPCLQIVPLRYTIHEGGEVIDPHPISKVDT